MRGEVAFGRARLGRGGARCGGDAHFRADYGFPQVIHQQTLGARASIEPDDLYGGKLRLALNAHLRTLRRAIEASG
jgi:hypothetical protein